MIKARRCDTCAASPDASLCRGCEENREIIEALGALLESEKATSQMSWDQVKTQWGLIDFLRATITLHQVREEREVNRDGGG